MNDKLGEAIQLRASGNTEASRNILLRLVSDHPNDPEILYQCAWTHDAMGLEREAIGFYDRAIEQGLKGDDLAGAYLGLGSTLRGLGEYARALDVLQRGITEFPKKNSIRIFFAMALYNAQRSKEAVSELLKIVAETSSDKDVTNFNRAILLYAQDLDRIWER